MERLEMMDDVRKYANLLMISDPNLQYNEATNRAKKELFGRDLDLVRYNEKEAQKENKVEVDDTVSYVELASRELSKDIRVELYSEEQLKEIIIAKRMGVNVEDFINIFYTPLQIRVITMASSLGRDITPYVTNLYFDPEEEMEKLKHADEMTDSKVYMLDNNSHN